MLLYSLFIISIFYNIKSIISDLNIVYDIQRSISQLALRNHFEDVVVFIQRHLHGFLVDSALYVVYFELVVPLSLFFAALFYRRLGPFVFFEKFTHSFFNFMPNYYTLFIGINFPLLNPGTILNLHQMFFLHNFQLFQFTNRKLLILMYK